jgi:filamentous hemagglutinin family protein
LGCTCALALLSGAASSAFAQPAGGVVVSGQAGISGGGNSTVITQSTQKAVINWQDFSVAAGGTVQFAQPNTQSITLNRVIGSGGSVIDGTLSANGQVWIINPNGVLFGKGSQVHVGGLSINLDGSYALGDWLTVYSDQLPEPVYGCVTGVTWRSTFLMLEDGRRLMVPNHILTANPVLNHSRPSDAKRFDVEVNIDIRVPCDRTMDMLLGEAIKTVRTFGMAPTPEPTIVVDRIDSDGIYYRARFYAYPERITPSVARSVMYRALLRVIQQSAMPLPVTQIEMAEPLDLSQGIGPDAIPEGLRHASLFAEVLNDEQILLLSTRSNLCEFRQGAVLMEQGAAASSMFIILEGAARITLVLAEGLPQELAVLASGDVVGEMSLMTGAPRSATVTAMTRIRAIEITKESIEELLQRSPELLLRFSELLALRQQEQSNLANRAVFKSVQLDMMTRMKAFFSRVLG